MLHQQKPSFVETGLFPAAEIKKIESQAANFSEIKLYHLMEAAGLALWQYVLNHWPKAQKLTIICGKGNNAGDGFVLARIAANSDKSVQVLVIDPDAEYQGDALKAHSEMIEQGVQTRAFDDSLLDDQDLIVDGILGTGLKGSLRKNFQDVIESVNAHALLERTPIFSIDIPSGLESDTGFENPVAIKATRTLTFVAQKSGMVTGHARACCGIIELADLGISSEIINHGTPMAWIDDADALINSLPKRSIISHKGDHGHLLLIGGDYGFGGAILMSAIAAARCGAGKLTILTRDAHVAPILTQCPEAMIRSVTGADDPALDSILSNVNAVVIGPGLGQEEWGIGLLETICACDLPMLVDADALNILSVNKKNSDHWVMTPHPGEAGRLLGIDTAEIQKDRYKAVRDLQKTYSGVAVLKGAGSLIADSNQSVTVCNEGNPGMASAGMGDILSGIIGSLLAQGLEVSLAARIGVALHARAGDLAAMKGQKGLMATDLIDPLRILVNP